MAPPWLIRSIVYDRTGRSAREDAAQLIEEATKLRQEVDWMLEHAPRGKGTTADLAVLASDASSIEASLKEARAPTTPAGFSTRT